MRPAVGSRKCVSRLKQVVLPAPLGPIRAWMLPRRTFRCTSFTATKPLNSFVSPRVSRMISSAKSVLGRRALVDERVHAVAAFLVREARRDDARGKHVRLLQAEVHLLVEGALARRHGGRRFFRYLPCKCFGLFRQPLGGYYPVDQAPLERLARVDQVAGEQHLEGVLALQAAP